MALTNLILRRTKQTRDVDGQLIVQLPQKDIQLVTLEFSKAEREFYEAVFNRSKLNFEAFVASGVGNSSYITFFALLLRLRQTCDHPMLVLGRSEANEDVIELTAANYSRLLAEFQMSDVQEEPNSESSTNGASQEMKVSTYLKNVIQEIQEQGLDSQECPICLDTPKDPILTRCAHILCQECATNYLERDNCSLCPVCQSPAQVSDLIRIKFPEVPSKSQSAATNNDRDLFFSTKLKRLMSDLERFRIDDQAQNTSTKIVVFSQWTHMLDIVEKLFALQKVPHVRFDGTLNRRARERVLKTFNEDSQCRVLLVSLRAGGVGLNLTAASVVILLDPWWVSKRTQRGLHTPTKELTRILLWKTKPSIASTVWVKTTKSW